MNLREKQLDYYKKWESLRSNKLKYLLKKSLLGYALPFSIGMTLFELVDSRFVFSYKILTDFLFMFIIAFILGIVEALFSFRMNGKKHIEFKRKSSQ